MMAEVRELSMRMAQQRAQERSQGEHVPRDIMLSQRSQASLVKGGKLPNLYNKRTSRLD